MSPAIKRHKLPMLKPRLPLLDVVRVKMLSTLKRQPNATSTQDAPTDQAKAKAGSNQGADTGPNTGAQRGGMGKAAKVGTQ